MATRVKLMLSGGREAEVGPCPCDERGDKLRELMDAVEGNDKLTMAGIQKAYTEIALEALGLFSPGLARSDALHSLDMADCYAIVKALWSTRA